MILKLKYYIFSLIVAVLFLQLYIIFIADSEIDNLARAFLLTIILGAFIFRFVNRRSSFHTPFMDFYIHASTFLIVNLSFWIHAGFILQGSLSQGWVGVTIIMPAIWGLGLLVESIATFFSKSCRAIKV